MKVTRTAIRLALLALLAAGASGCGGGGAAGSVQSGSGGGSGGDEFSLSGGLGPINAQAAYDDGYTGLGVTVAVIDTGVDVTHPELVENIVGSFVVSDSDPGPVDPHGTFVAGLIAAEQNGELINGVAYDAGILSIKASQEIFGPDGVSSTFDRADLAEGILLASGLDAANPDVEADILNLSLGGPGVADVVFDALVDSVAAGKLVVIAAGNTDLGDPLAPASLAADAAMNGQIIAVGSVGPDNVISDFSATAGAIRDFFVVAPGEDVVSIGPGDTEQWIGTGTSFSTAFVSGAAAVLMDAFPHLTAVEIAEIIFVTATDLGDPGVDNIYGNGLIDLEQAIQPIGTLTVSTGSTVDGAGAGLATSSLLLGPAFGDSLSRLDLFSEAVAFDDYGRPYRTDLRSLVLGSNHGLALGSLVLASDERRLELASTSGFSLRLSFRADDPGDLVAEARAGIGPVDAQPRFGTATAVIALGDGGSLRLGKSVRPGAWFALEPRTGERADTVSLFHDVDGARLPQLALVGQADGAAYSGALDRNTRVTLAWLTNQATAGQNGSHARLTQGMVSHHLTGSLTVGFAFGAVEEDDAFLASRSSGAFGTFDGARSRFVTLMGRFALDNRNLFVGSYTRVRASLRPAANGLIRDWDTVGADAATAGFIRTGLLTEDDRAGLMVSQPLRLTSGEATLTVPVGRDLEGGVIRRRRNVDLVPSGREINLQLAYERPMDLGARITGYLFLRHEPDHVLGARPDTGFALRMILDF